MILQSSGKSVLVGVRWIRYDVRCAKAIPLGDDGEAYDHIILNVAIFWIGTSGY